MTLKIRYTHLCDMCGREEPEPAVQLLPGQVMPDPAPPIAWRRVRTALVCDKHKIMIDDKPLI